MAQIRVKAPMERGSLGAPDGRTYHVEGGEFLCDAADIHQFDNDPRFSIIGPAAAATPADPEPARAAPAPEKPRRKRK